MDSGGLFDLDLVMVPCSISGKDMNKRWSEIKVDRSTLLNDDRQGYYLAVARNESVADENPEPRSIARREKGRVPRAP